VKVIDFDATVLDASFSISKEDAGWSLVFESSGGRAGGPNPRNLQYRRGLNVLVLLFEQPERVFRRREITQRLWQSTYVGDERACDAHVSALRKKIERDHTHPERIVTVPGFGYKLVAA
jgi:hypothetical protein